MLLQPVWDEIDAQTGAENPAQQDLGREFRWVEIEP